MKKNNLADMKNPKLESTRDGYGQALVELGSRNRNVVVVSADLAESTRVHWFKEKFPDRFVEVGVAEQNMMGVAAGLALSGKTAFASSFAAFSPGRNWEQLRVSVCYSKANVKIVSTHAGISVGADGASHQALEDIAITRVLPNLTVIVPADSLEAKKAVFAAAGIKGPVYIRCGREKLPVVTAEKSVFKIGTANILKEGSDAAIIACGSEVYEALVAAEQLAKKKIKVRVINSHTIKQLDEKTIIAAARQTGAIVTAEEHQIAGGLGSAVAELLSENYPVPIIRVGVKDKFGESGSAQELMAKYGLKSDSIIKAVNQVLKMKK